ncbi:MAG TPA: 4-hydroxythreonine-4-phosphate dehydrogenase PdxA [Opitutales bacterium]|nr:4-hydroxythreonine-4-phosphate dehydrogenase PdxA [Opitutales bacterium]
MTKKIAISCGDPAGVGPEIIARWAEIFPEAARRAIVVGPSRWLEETESLAECEKRSVGSASFVAIPGKPDLAGAKIAFEALEEVARLCLEGEAAGAVTAPVSKTWMQRVGFAFPGQTEFFAARWGGEPVMAFVGKRLRVVLATWHIPLGTVAEELDEKRLGAAVSAAEELVRLGGETLGEHPRIGVCGLNPHAGEGGVLGTEERDWIDPFLDRLRERFPGVSCTQPADTIFWRALRGEFDVVVALYHDQGLAPLKTIDFEEAVNVTLGLPYLRTSPDHGTAFDIAGKGIADIRSFARAVELC